MSDKKSISLKKIVIKIKDKELSLSLNEAKELISVLTEVTGKDRITKEYIPSYPYYPLVEPYKPFWNTTAIGKSISYGGKIMTGEIHVQRSANNNADLVNA